MIRKDIIVITSSVLIFVACSSDNKKGMEGTANAAFNSEKGIISLTLDNLPSCNYELKVKNNIIGSGTIKENSELNILKLIKKKSDVIKDIALYSVQNNNELEVSLNITDILDTVFTYHLVPNVTIPDNNVEFIGVGAKVVSKKSNRNVDEDLKRWLYRKHEILKDSQFSSLRNNYLYLTESKNNDYVTRGEIPVLHKVGGNKYSVTSNMVADYYAVVACGDQNYIDKFVENSVVKDYKNLSTTKTNLTCVSENEKGGYLCVMLLGINKDYSYQQQPIAVVVVDNVAPENDYLPGRFEAFEFKDGLKVIMPQNAPIFRGNANVRIINSAGNGMDCNVTFVVSMFGDTKSVTLQRKGQLCGPDFDRNHLRAENKVVLARDGYEQRFTWKLHLEDGDNEIPVIAEDIHGNTRTFKVVHTASFVRRDTPSISIDNNIENNIFN